MNELSAKTLLTAWVVSAALTWTGCTQFVAAPSSSPIGASVLIGAADIGVCGSAGAAATGRLLDSQPQGTVFAAGDLAYEHGTADQFLNCYGPNWGRHKNRTRPAPGNHEYESPGATPYFDYFGAFAGPPGLGYYRYSSGSWQIYSLNSNMEAASRTTEREWLRSELAVQPSTCSLAYFHHPLFSSGPHGLEPPVPIVQGLWEELYNAGVEIVIVGHDHLYERFAPQSPDGRSDPEYGIRQFTVGTGGAPPALAFRRAPNSELLLSTFGLLRLTLESGSYRWDFLSAEGGAVLDSGSGRCHAAGPAGVGSIEQSQSGR